MKLSKSLHPTSRSKTELLSSHTQTQNTAILTQLICELPFQTRTLNTKHFTIFTYYGAAHDRNSWTDEYVSRREEKAFNIQQVKHQNVGLMAESPVCFWAS